MSEAEPRVGGPRPPIVLLAPGNSIHTQRWANGLVRQGWPVMCLSAHDFLPQGWEAGVQRRRLRASAPWAYLIAARAVRRAVYEWRAALVHVHYATGYGLLGTLAGCQPRLVSVWGMDIFDFPRRSPLHRALVRQVLRRSRAVASTSRVMAAEVHRLMGPDWRVRVPVTPFGVDLNHFRPVAERPTETACVTIGTVKTLAPKYGIDTLLRAVALLRERRAGRGPDLALRITGGGPQAEALQAQARALGLDGLTVFTGPVAHSEVPRALHALDIFVAVSRDDSESFGVAAIEAGACGLPVVVSDAGGLPEVVDHGVTGLVVPRDNPAALADALERLVDDPALRRRLGEAGRAHVALKYDWHASVRRMTALYEAVLSGRVPEIET